MKRHLAFWAAVVTLAASCQTNGSGDTTRVNKDTVFTVVGDIKGLDSGYVYFFNYQSPGSSPDSAKVTNGRFIFTGKADTPTYYLLGIMNFGRMEYRRGFFAEHDTVTISGRKDVANDLRTTGGPVEEEHNLFLAARKLLEDEQRKFSKTRDSLLYMKNYPGADSVARIVETFDAKFKAQVKDFAAKHPSSYAAAYEIYQEYAYAPDETELEPIFNGLGENIRASYFGRKLAGLLEIAKRTSVGHLAPEFSQADVNGKEIALSSYRQKYVLVDFWASWCIPCRLEHPNLKKAYAKFHDKGFEILGVSLDEKKDRWLSAIKQDSLQWNNVSDLKGWKNSVATLYGVEAIPMNFLLDKDGRIVAKGLKGNELLKKLEEIIK